MAHLPKLKDIGGILKYLNLDKNATKETIRKTVNIRLMELTNESLVSDSIFSTIKFTNEERQNHVMFLNEASDVLMKWKDSN